MADEGHYDQHGRWLPRLKTTEKLKHVPFEMYARVLARAASLEKSVTVLRAENVELREIAGGLSYYADGHGLQEKWAAELRALNQRLAALAQATEEAVKPG